MDNDTQSKLDKLARIEATNRARSKKYLDSLKAQDKRQVSIIMNNTTIDTLDRLRGESIAAGKPLTYGDILSVAINSYVSIDKNITLIENLKNVNRNVNSDKVIKKKRKKNVKYDINIDVKDFTHDNVPTNEETIYKVHLDKILKKIKPGHWKKEAEALNKRGIKTPKGKQWTDNNLRALYNSRIKK